MAVGKGSGREQLGAATKSDCVTAPTPKEMALVREVMVMEGPICESIVAILSSTGIDLNTNIPAASSIRSEH